MAHSMVPPTESPLYFACRILCLILSSRDLFINGSSSSLSFNTSSLFKLTLSKLSSSISFMDDIWESIYIPLHSNICLHMAPAKTKGAVSLPENDLHLYSH